MNSAADLVVFRSLEQADLPALRLFNAATFPIQYSDKFYSSLMSLPDQCQLAYDGTKLVGAIACRTELTPTHDVDLYIMTLGVRPQYRRNGLASRLLQRVVLLDELEGIVRRVYLHVQTSNQAALDFYTRLGFSIQEELKNYYKRVDPPHCYILTCPFSDLKLRLAEFGSDSGEPNV